MDIRVGIVEDNDGLRASLAQTIEAAPGFACVWACASAEEAPGCVERIIPEVVLMDIHLPGQSGIECVRQLRRRWPQLQVLILTIDGDSRLVFAALAAGAVGYLVKNVAPPRLLEAIREVWRGGSPMSSKIARMLVNSFEEPGPPEEAALSPRENEVLQLVAEGYRSKEIADALAISKPTVESHMRSIYRKLQVRSRAEAVMKRFGAPA